MITFSKQPMLLASLKRIIFQKRAGVIAHQKFPKLRIRLESIKVDPKHLNTYRKLCLNTSHGLPVLYPHVMASKLHMYLFSHPDFPLNLIGAVHKNNIITTATDLDPHETYQIEVSIKGERYFSKGVEFDVETLLILNNSVVWSETSTYLKRQHFDINLKVETNSLPTISEALTIDSWFIRATDARKYAYLSNDYNLIHLNPFLAKLFGMESSVAHGMCSAAQTLSKVETNLENKVIQVFFKGPCILNKEVTLIKDNKNNKRYDLRCDGNIRPIT